ncbi:MAG: hypothetical protein U0Q18_25365 [Bryobacteraceae bacterium]
MMLGLGSTILTADAAQAIAQTSAADPSIWAGFWNWLHANNPEPKLGASGSTPSPGNLPVAAPAAPTPEQAATWTPEEMYAATWSNEQSNISNFFNSIPVSSTNSFGQDVASVAQPLADIGKIVLFAALGVGAVLLLTRRSH